MYLLNGNTPDEIEETTFAELGKKESDIEELLRKNINMICDDAESMLTVGQQVKNAENGRSDLTAIDNDGNIVLIEIKRDKKDIGHRKEAFEFQAIRYAASCATIKDTDELVQDIFAPYVEKHKNEFSSYGDSLTSTEIAQRVLKDFIDTNGIKDFNEKQRIILVASEFDPQTLSAVAWLNSNQVDIACYQITPYKFDDSIIIDMKKVLPVPEYSDFFVDVVNQKVLVQGQKKSITRKNLPKIDALMKYHVILSGALFKAKDRDSEAVLQDDGQVKIKDSGQVTSLQQWLKGVYGWSSVETYALTVDVQSGKTLSELRAAYMEKNQELPEVDFNL
ncbi:MAG: hypothetical protein LKG40_05340 [Lachnospiraceae bacterium]|jgi:hypothetical protein|nr:hypothetical protein [Lachnospiraceae bacterium]MCI1329213.1 hypothetical protein [Lachnospiraceae bacterium]